MIPCHDDFARGPLGLRDSKQPLDGARRCNSDPAAGNRCPDTKPVRNKTLRESTLISIFNHFPNYRRLTQWGFDGFLASCRPHRFASGVRINVDFRSRRSHVDVGCALVHENVLG